MQPNLRAKQAEQAEAKQFLDFIDRVSTALFGCVFDDCTPTQRAVVLDQVEEIHMAQVN